MRSEDKERYGEMNARGCAEYDHPRSADPRRGNTNVFERIGMIHKGQESAAILMSGGLDSTTLLYDAIAQGVRRIALTVNYGQLQQIEIERARAICQSLDVEHEVIAIASLPYRGGSYEVCNRNAALISLGAAIASARGFRAVAIGCNEDDASAYSDCTPEFISRMDEAMQLACGVSVIAPYLHGAKAKVVARARRMGVPIGETWSCYNSGPEPCGKCLACLSRSSALEVSP